MKSQIGEKVIVRANMAGVFFGTLVSKKKDQVLLSNARKIYRWQGANTVEDMADKGFVNSENCKITVVVSEIEIYGVAQTLTCTEKAINNIEKISEWKAE